jgi:predicted kinase
LFRRERAPERHDLTGVVLVTGVSAAGKTTVSKVLAEQLPRSVHLRGDAFRRMIVSGRVDVGPNPSAEALEQLDLRYRLSADAADTFAAAGFTVIVEDVVVGSALPRFVDRIQTRPCRVVMLHPRPEVVAARDASRATTGYEHIDLDEFWQLVDAETPRLGLWLDNGRQAPLETVSQVLARRDDALVA